MTRVDALERWDRLPAVRTARAILRDALGLELLVVGPRGPVAHARGGVMSSSNEVCRAALFSRDGFARCDAFYRAVGDGGDAPAEALVTCHLGLAAVSVPIRLGDETLAMVVASGFSAENVKGATAVDPPRLAEAIRALDPNLVDPGALVRTVRTVRGDRVDFVRATLRTAAREIAIDEENRRARLASDDAEAPGRLGIVGRSPQMQSVFEQIERVAASDATVLVLGESGTGKELVAKALHAHGRRSAKPFIAQSCAAMSDELLESALFGHVRGAFSGAIRSSTGLFAAAEGGTLFLDEVGEMSPSLQVKLLRVLQDKTYMPVGATSPRSADVRVIAATHRDLAKMVETGAFRQDLYYRLHVLPIHLPPLRERAGDLRLLVSHFLARGIAGNAPRKVSNAAWSCLERYAWPGNVRELRSELERSGLTAGDAIEIGPEHLSRAVREAGGYTTPSGGDAVERATLGASTLAEAVEALERALIERGLERTRGNRTQLAKELGISRTTLNERLKKYGME
jgi:transcriptional regulator with PAS, ATPase and Fis domain